MFKIIVLIVLLIVNDVFLCRSYAAYEKKNQIYFLKDAINEKNLIWRICF